MAKGRIKIKNLLLTLLFVVTIVIVGVLFTNLRTNALDSESFEAAPLNVYNVESFDEL